MTGDSGRITSQLLLDNFRDAIKQNPDLLVDVYRTGNFGVYLGRILIHKYKGWSVANLVLAALFALLTVAAEGLLYHGLPQEWVRMSAISRI